MPKKPWKIEFSDVVKKQLDELPEEERVKVLESLANFDPDDPIPNIKAVRSLPKGSARVCLLCGGALVQRETMVIRDKTMDVLECDPCDEPYMAEAAS